MVVRSEEELKELLDQEWKLYFHSRVKRWYLYKGAKERRIVGRNLDNLCESLHEGKSGIAVAEIHRMRLEGRTLSQIAAETGISERAVANAMDREEDEVIKPRESVEVRIESGENLEQGVSVDSLIAVGLVPFFSIGIVGLWTIGNWLMGKFGG
ncbi:MAG: hypothetical protein QHH00_04215 [Methanomassiliicoccales archaeon]|jgi:hypothetical protein|nr:hypothetical protein [Methanomassiliicoccales archaeon]